MRGCAAVVCKVHVGNICSKVSAEPEGRVLQYHRQMEATIADTINCRPRACYARAFCGRAIGGVCGSYSTCVTTRISTSCKVTP